MNAIDAVSKGAGADAVTLKDWAHGADGTRPCTVTFKVK
jgi:hypothetical protein